jgi:hypothetical protein
MIRHYQHHQIDKSKWDECVNHSVNTMIYAYSWYLDIVCKNWEALIEDDYKSIFPLTCRRKSGINYLFQPAFTQQLGIFSLTNISEQKVSDYIEAIPKKYKIIEVNLNTENSFSSKNFSIKKNLTHELSLNTNYDELSGNFSSNTKRNIKKALASNILINDNADLNEIINIFRKNRGRDIRTLKNKEYKILLQLTEECKKREGAEVLGAYTSDNKFCAGAVFIKTNKRTIFLFSSTNEQAKKTSAMSFLIDHYINSHSSKEMVLDFEGSNDPDLARFYKSFGSKEKYYLQIISHRLSPLLQKGMDVYRKIRE